MAMAFVQGVSVSGAAGTSPQAAPAFGSAVANGDLIVVLAGGDGGATGLATGVTDSLGNTYTRVPSFDFNNAGGTLNMDAFYAVVNHAGSGNVVTLTFTSASENCVLVVQHFNGFTGTATYDKKSTSSNVSSTTITSGATGTLAQANSLVVGLGIHASTVSAISLGAGYTNLTTVSIAARQSAMESKVVASTAAVTATFTIAAARVNLGGVLVFNDTVSTGPQTLTGSGFASTNSFGGGAVAMPIHSLSDDLTTTNTAVWTDAVVAGITVSRSAAGTTFTYPTPTTSSVYGETATQPVYSLTGDAVYVQAAAVPSSAAGHTDMDFAVMAGTSTLRFAYEAGSLFAQHIVGGTITTVFSTTYNATNHSWWKIAESGGTITWYTSPDGATWTSFASETSPMNTGAVLINLNANCWGADATPGTAVFKNLNTGAIPGQTLTGTGLASTVAFGGGSLATGPARLAGTGLASTNAFGTGAVVPGAVAITGTAFANTPSGNLVTNGDFESGSTWPVTGWVSTNGGSISLDTTAPQSGTQSVKIVVDASNTNIGIKAAVTSPLTVAPSTSYVLRMYVKSDTAGALQVQLADSQSVGRNYVQNDGVTWNTTATYQTIPTTTAWSLYEFAFTTGASQTQVFIFDLKRSGTATQASRTFWLDNVQVPVNSGANFGAGTVTPRITLTGTGLTPTNAFGAGTISVSTVQITGTGYLNTQAFGTTGTVTFSQTLVGTGFANTNSFGSGTVVRGTVTLVGTGWVNAQAFGAGTLTIGPIHILGTGFANSQTFGGGKLTLPQYITGTGFTNSNSFGTGNVAGMPLIIQGTGCLNVQAFGSAGYFWLRGTPVYPTTSIILSSADPTATLTDSDAAMTVSSTSNIATVSGADTISSVSSDTNTKTVATPSNEVTI